MSTSLSGDKRAVHELIETWRRHGVRAYERELGQRMTPEAAWQGPHPINLLDGRDAYLKGFLHPLMASFPDLERRVDLLFGGACDGARWICTTGYYVGTFDADWLGIPATGNLAYLRYGEFVRMERGRIAASYVLLDLLDLMHQAGVSLLPPSIAVDGGIVPGPATRDGVVLEEQNQAQTQATLKLVDDMIFEGLHQYDGQDLDTMRHHLHWHPDFMWYGPAGIGTTRGIRGFKDWHQTPFLDALPDRKGGTHVARFADGCYAASTGWYSLSATHTGSLLYGLAPTGRKVGMRVMDFWRREDNLLRENWVLIDTIEYCLQLGYDLFERLRLQRASRTPPGSG
ncbi:ester cyclase [Candidatus Foliamicus sp.]